jgi:hypothetical protein
MIGPIGREARGSRTDRFFSNERVYPGKHMATFPNGVEASPLPLAHLPEELEDVLRSCPGFAVANSLEDLLTLALRDADETGWHEVSYALPDGRIVPEARVCRVKNGIAANYLEPYMRRRDPDCMVIGDHLPTDKPTFEQRFGESFDDLRKETFEWLKTQELAMFAFKAGGDFSKMYALAVAPANAGFFAFGLALLQGFVPLSELPDDVELKGFIYTAPPFRHTHFDGKQVVVHSRGDDRHEIFSYNLYPGPSAKKGVYGMLLNLGEKERWTTIHGSTVQVITPYDNRVVITHEGASGGGKSEMLEHPHRELDGTLKLGTNVVTDDTRFVTVPQGCTLRPVTDDMALCHPDFQTHSGRLSVRDAEQAWFVRVNHIEHYGTDPNLEKLTVHPAEPLLFLNIDATPGSTALIWDHIEDAPGKPCPNPRVVIPRHIVPGVRTRTVDVDIRTFGVRTPPCTAENPTYGILGIFHLLPPSLAWLWRLVSPRGHANPSITDTTGMTSEGVGSYWPFATGRKVEQANLLLELMQQSPRVRYAVIPNQHVGAWKTGFMPQWMAREYFARRGGVLFSRAKVKESRCPLLGYTPGKIQIEGQTIGPWFFEVESQPEVGEAAYDRGAELLTAFFREQLEQFVEPDLDPLGQRIIDCFMSGGSVDDYRTLLDLPMFEEDDY